MTRCQDAHCTWGSTRNIKVLCTNLILTELHSQTVQPNSLHYDSYAELLHCYTILYCLKLLWKVLTSLLIATINVKVCIHYDISSARRTPLQLQYNGACTIASNEGWASLAWHIMNMRIT
jgi:hypothetical protein